MSDWNWLIVLVVFLGFAGLGMHTAYRWGKVDGRIEQMNEMLQEMNSLCECCGEDCGGCDGKSR